MYHKTTKKKSTGIITDPMKQDVRLVFAKRLKKARMDKGYSLRKLEAISGVSNATISQYEHCVYGPTITRVRALALVLDVSQGYLLGDPENLDWLNLELKNKDMEIESLAGDIELVQQQKTEMAVDLRSLAMLASDVPLFTNPVHLVKAKSTRDEILKVIKTKG